MTVRPGRIAWSWPGALRGLICALPGAPLMLGWDVSAGICFALGTLSVAMIGVPARRRERPRLVAIGPAPAREPRAWPRGRVAATFADRLLETAIGVALALGAASCVRSPAPRSSAPAGRRRP